MRRPPLLLALLGAVLLCAAAVVVIVNRSDHPSELSASVIGPSSTTTGPPPDPVGAPYAVTFRNGLPAPNWQELQLRVLTLGALDAPPAVVGSELTQGASFADGVATYFERQSPDPVRRIGVQARFPQTDDQRPAVAMIIADGPLPDMVSTVQRPNFGVHFVATATTWELDIWPGDGDKVRLLAGGFDAAVFPGPIRYEVQREGATVRVIQPDGKVTAITDERIDRFSGRWMCWELFQDGGGVASAGIETWWAQ